MQYEDLKDVFYFKTGGGTSAEVFKAEKVSKHTWNISCDLHAPSSIWDYDDFLCHLNDGSWVIQGEEDMGKPVEQKPQQKSTIEIETLRDKFAMVALQGWIAGQPTIKKQPLNGTEEHTKLMTELAYHYADAMITERSKKG